MLEQNEIDLAMWINLGDRRDPIVGLKEVMAAGKGRMLCCIADYASHDGLDYAPDDLAAFQDEGYIGYKIWAGPPSRRLEPGEEGYPYIDDPAHDPTFRRLEEIGMPCASIHIADPNGPFSHRTKWLPDPVEFWREMMAYRNRIEKHPDLTFVTAHAMWSICQDAQIDYLRFMLSTYPNVYIDLAATFQYFPLVDAENPSGVATITVDERDENCDAVASGANSVLSPADIDSGAPQTEAASVLLMQLETPVPTIEHAASLGKMAGKTVILNPAPAQPLSDGLLALLDVLTPNETEAELLTGVKVETEDDAERAARVLRDKGIGVVIITLGARGTFVLSDSFLGLVPAPKVEAVDTTAAGDTFNGALAVGLASGQTIDDAVVFANKAAAISVTRLGAQASTPTLEEMEKSEC
jgi:ribokinase